jgi:hypothetical protein
MVVFAIVAALYAAALAVVVVSPRGGAMRLDLDDTRDAARLWCAAIVLVTGFLTYAAGTVAYRWRKAYRQGR